MRVFVCCAGLLSLGAWLAGSAPVLAQDQASDCAVCHDEVVSAFQKTGHGIASGVDPEAACRGCHGPGEAHIDGGGDLDAIVRPQLLSPRAASDTCLSCHQHYERHFAGRQAMHRLEDVGCLDCHAAHSTKVGMLARSGLGLCGECHQAVVGQFELPRAHPIDDSGEACASCHEPHATRTVRSSRALYDRTCGNCHFEKVGPFVYSHDSVLDDGCAACHETHGSANRHLLRHEVQVNLCYECHSAAFTPGFHRAATYVNQKCTSCHSAIHGSNTDQLFLEN